MDMDMEERGEDNKNDGNDNNNINNDDDDDKKKKGYCSPLPASSSSAKHSLDQPPEFILSSHVVSLLLGDLSPGQAFEKWVALVRKRSSTKIKPSAFRTRTPTQTQTHLRTGSGSACTPSLLYPPHRHMHSAKTEGIHPVEQKTQLVDRDDQPQETTLWERLANSVSLDIQSTHFSWHRLHSLHHTEHTSTADQSEDECNKVLEVTVNSGGVVFFALFSPSNNNDAATKEAAAVIKFSSSSRMATQSERLGYEFAKHLGINTPQARVIHNSNEEWQRIREAAEKARESAASNGEEVGEMTCSDMLEALELSRCLFLMNYVHGSPLLETPKAFITQEAAGITAASLGRVLLLDLILCNEDRLPCRELGWRGNPANLMISDSSTCNTSSTQDRIPKVPNNPFVNSVLQKEQRSNSADVRIDSHQPQLIMKDKGAECFENFTVVAIDSGVPRRPPAGKRAKDNERYPKLVELILNCSGYSENILYEISGGRLGFPEDGTANLHGDIDMAAVVHEFRGGFRTALRDVQGFHLFLLTLYQKLEVLLRAFSSIIAKNSGDNEMSDLGVNEAGLQMDSESNRSYQKSSLSGSRGTQDSTSPVGRCSKTSGEKEMFRGIRLTLKLRDFQKAPKVDAEVAKEIESWNERVKTEVVKFCEENNFNTGFFDGLDSNLAVDAYELKVRLEHILERITLISEAAGTERPSPVTSNLLIGGALAAKSIHTLQHLGITHILCLCSNEIGQSDSQFPELFQYKNFSISDDEDADISSLFEEASEYINYVQNSGGKILVHCFEGKSRSATVVLAYLILREGYTLAKAWAMLKKTHRRAQPNDGFAKALLTLDKRVHGKVSMDWQQKRPEMKVCPICSKNVGLSTSSLKLHLQKSHKRLSAGSVDSAMKVEIQKAMDNLRIVRTGSISPTGQTSFFGK
ncbi:dual specificity protein phosphatase family protein [Rhynchospora pubera]|uniref:Dual specificity protein phosphatase family protein n=1 Tax=Rhynchospora pubera TaxID=906938 RepID=A0AAV8EA83_9POAL|nr:dual specificity protein phosphatase family protein [Rhynchospora pubera]